MLDRSTYFIREHVGMLKLTNTYDILDPETQEQIGIAKEKPGTLVVLLRFLVNKQLLPTKVLVYEGDDPDADDQLLFSIQRGIAFLKTRVDISDAEGNLLGWLKSRVFSLGGAFDVFDSQGNQAASLKGDWKGWNFKFTDNDGNEIGTVTKKWAGLGKEFFTSADNYVINLTDGASSAKAVLLLAAGLAIDTVYKEH